ncbi:antiviral reverse transcriptase Drt3a [Pseudoalteromonas peptidolytica]|uniref:antiviral reverse transcriptase Drt3a n=1 Tax=Pseudoalteromonas peptidolytica TaxID=61150 RepID=UPI00298DF5A7|nr:antiviral reverse transcriptase Drt3a [Pseudoalteromonas peptidolytica]MDW7549819.1 antiviral reverse transcriptase Drt3a [Pseudoalteromonas peptidolytica]
MLKQVFDKEQLSKALTSSDVWKWNVLSVYGDVESAIELTVQYWNLYSLTLKQLEASTAKGRTVFVPAVMQDALAIKLLDRFIRRIYKVRQSDRNRIIRQLITLLEDSGNYHILRLDIKDCYESIKLAQLIKKFEDELILAPECIRLLYSIMSDLQTNHGVHGLPRGLPISSTLAELYLEALDKKIAVHPNIIYSARYVDDIIVVMPVGKEAGVKADVETLMNEMGLAINYSPEKYYDKATKSAEFDYLGYAIAVEQKNGKPNKVTLKISRSKLNKLKSRIVIGLFDHKKQNNISLLKRRLEYLCMLKVVRKGKNGDLLAGLAHNYQYVTDNFECLKSIDGFLCQQIANPRFGLTQQEQDKIKKVSIYGNARKGSIGKFSKRQTIKIMRVWKSA